jgi:hypothetical protein
VWEKFESNLSVCLFFIRRSEPKNLTCTLFIKMTLRKQKAERKQQLVKNVEDMKQELAKVSKNGWIEHQKNIFEIWFAFPKMVCFYPSSDLECFHLVSFQVRLIF